VQAATTLITTHVGYTGPGLDLSAFANGDSNFTYTFGPITVGQYTFTTTPDFKTIRGDGAPIGQGDYGLADNGRFGGDAVYIGQEEDGAINLMLNGGPVSQLGFFMNYVPAPPARAVTIAALDSMGNVFASYNINALAPISTPGGFNQTEFRGIASDTANIYGLRFGGHYLLVTGTADGTLAPAVTEPGTWALMLLGLFSIGGAMRAQKRRQSITVRYG
jgi:hypothetical protein